MNLIPWLQSNGDIVDLNWNVISSEERTRIIKTVETLPVRSFIPDVKDAVFDSLVTIISADTWSWKTTQIWKGLMERTNWRPIRIVEAEPRVIAAIWAAKRVSQEKLAETWDPIYSVWHRIWYRTGREVKSSWASELLFVTDQLQLLRQYVTDIVPDILIVDEVHTYWVATEFLLSQVRNTLMDTNKKIKLVLMSATMDIDLVVDYFKDITDPKNIPVFESVANAKTTSIKSSPVIEIESSKPKIKHNIPIFDIPWRTFPVEKSFKRWCEFFPSIVEFWKQGKNILVFVEWKKEIDKAIDNLKKQLPNYNIYPLHSELPISEQDKVLKKTDDKPVIVVATNVAQESITLDYINAVVDNWYCKVLRYNRLWVPELHRVPVSKADAMQRAWRAWRVMEWEYVRACDIDYRELEDFPTWEIENVTLERNILIALSVWFNPLRNIKAWRKVFVHQPEKALVEISYDNLIKIWAITKDHLVTRLWRELLNFPLEPMVWRMLKEWTTRWCAWDMVEICAIINHKWFLSRWQEWKHIVKWCYKQDSDLIAQRELLRFLTRRDPIDKDTLRRLRSEEFWIDRHELNLFQQIAENGKDKMLFEVVDFTKLWIKQKRLYEIIETMKKLFERLAEWWYPIDFVDSAPGQERTKQKRNEKYAEINKCILSWMLNNIFAWQRKEKMFFHNKKWWFKLPDTSTMTPSDSCKYCWNPFVIWWTWDWEDLPLLSFVTKVDEAMIDEMSHWYMQEEFSDITFGYKDPTKWKKKWRSLEPRVIANLQREAGWVTFSKVLVEITHEKRKSVLSLAWLPDYLIENNQVIIKYINSYKWSKPKFNIDRFKAILSIFTSQVKDRFHMENLQKTLNAFKFDTSIFDSYMDSNLPWVVEFRKNPCKVEYDEALVLPKISISNSDIIRLDQEDSQPIRHDPRQHYESREDRTWLVHIIDLLRKKSKYSRNKIREFLAYWVVTLDGKKLTENSYIKPNSDISIDFTELRVLQAIEKAERLKWDKLSEVEYDQIRFDIESQYIKKHKKHALESTVIDQDEDEESDVTKVKKRNISKPKNHVELPKTSKKYTWDKMPRKLKKKISESILTDDNKSESLKVEKTVKKDVKPRVPKEERTYWKSKQESQKVLNDWEKEQYFKSLEKINLKLLFVKENISKISDQKFVANWEVQIASLERKISEARSSFIQLRSIESHANSLKKAVENRLPK